MEKTPLVPQKCYPLLVMLRKKWCALDMRQGPRVEQHFQNKERFKRCRQIDYIMSVFMRTSWEQHLPPALSGQQADNQRLNPAGIEGILPDSTLI